jgi:hypothetical protein
MVTFVDGRISRDQINPHPTTEAPAPAAAEIAAGGSI